MYKFLHIFVAACKYAMPDTLEVAENCLRNSKGYMKVERITVATSL